MNRYIGPLIWAWLIIIGGLMITPDGIECIACGVVFSRLIGVASIVLGAAGFIANRQSQTAGR